MEGLGGGQEVYGKSLLNISVSLKLKVYKFLLKNRKENKITFIFN